jgi:hypothetical protein
MIFEATINDSDDGQMSSCHMPFGGGCYWQIRRNGFHPKVHNAWIASTERHTVNRETLLRFAYLRGACQVLGVSLDPKHLQSFVERLQGDDLEIRTVENALLVRQGLGYGIIYEIAFADGPVADAKFTLTYDERKIATRTLYRQDILEATNKSHFLAWVRQCVDGPAKAPHSYDFERVDMMLERAPVFGAPVPTLWFDGDGNGPDVVEVMVDGYDSISSKTGKRMLSRRVALSVPGTVLTGGGSLRLRELDSLIEQLTKAREWMLAGQLVEGCECGICHPTRDHRLLCDGAQAVAEASNSDD